MDNLWRFPAPWTMEERKDGFEVKDASGFFICGVPSVKISIATATSTPANSCPARRRDGSPKRSRLPELLKRPQY